jgi:hypothetical protein
MNTRRKVNESEYIVVVKERNDEECIGMVEKSEV